MDYYYTDRANRVHGPVSVDQLRSLVTAGTLNASCMIVPVGSEQWKPIGSLIPIAGPASNEPIPNYLVQSILVTFCCCMPLGIVAIVYAAQVDGKVSSGDIVGAQQSSQTAKTWCFWGFMLGLCSNVLIYGLAGISALVGH